MTVTGRTRIDRDLIAACRRLGELGLAAEVGRRSPELEAVARTADGLHRLLIEARAAEQEGVDHGPKYPDGTP